MKKIFSIYLTIILLITPYIKAEATENIVNTEGSTNIRVIADLTTSFEVILPSTLTIEDFGDTTFYIKGDGILSEYEFLCIDLQDSITMTESNNETKYISIRSDKEGFFKEDFLQDDGGTITCFVDSKMLPSGYWTGDLNVNVSVKDLCGLHSSVNFDSLTFKTIVQNKTTGEIITYSTREAFYYMDSYNYIYNDHKNMECYIYQRMTDGTWKTTSEYMENITISMDDYIIIHNNYDILDSMCVYAFQKKQCSN